MAKKAKEMEFTKQQGNGEFVTVVSIGLENTPPCSKPNISEYVTVLTIGEASQLPEMIVEEVLVYRLPGERLGFGLKFEGGTKAAECVKHLFIQSCAPDSPASRASSSWGKLNEGDEILEIDSLPVKKMTRIDCVRCLKDSNVVIKLLVKHVRKTVANLAADTVPNGDLPLVVSAEKKHPPLPPAVPPRKIPRKLYKRNNSNNNSEEANVVVNGGGVCPPMPPVRKNCTEQVTNGNKQNRFSSPHSIRKHGQNRNVLDQQVRDRPSVDFGVGPPDPEIYTDLFSHESNCSLSESDDTESSVSTIIDHLSSSLAGSLPSTPTATQKHLDLKKLNSYDSDDVDFEAHHFENCMSTTSSHLMKINGTLSQVDVDQLYHSQSKRTSLQPSTCFQDAALSYGDEEVSISSNDNNVPLHDDSDSCLANGFKSAVENDGINYDGFNQSLPSPPPRCKNQVIVPTVSNSASMVDHAADLPRLVDFVPKCNVTLPNRDFFNSERNLAGSVEIVEMFLDNEKRASDDSFETSNADNKNMTDIVANYCCDRNEYHNFNWKCYSLATIGEDEEECSQDYLLQT